MKYRHYEIRLVEDNGEEINPVSMGGLSDAGQGVRQYWTLYGRFNDPETTFCLPDPITDSLSLSDCVDIYNKITGNKITVVETLEATDYFDLPAYTQWERTHPTPETVAFMSIGADAEMRSWAKNSGSSYIYPDMDGFSGHIGFMDELLRHAMLVDQVGDYLSEHNLHNGVFAYDIAEPFGALLAEQMLETGEAVDAGFAEWLLATTLQQAGYSNDVLRAALKEATT